MNWHEFRGAPESGTTLARSNDVPDGQSLCRKIGAFPVLLVRVSGTVAAYVNACPHQFLPLDQRGRNLMSADGKTLRCTNHAAGFDAATGKGTEGLGLNSALVPIPCLESDGVIRIAA